MITWYTEMLSVPQARPDCISEDWNFLIRGVGTLEAGEHVNYPTDGSVPKLYVCEYPPFGGNVAFSLRIAGRGTPGMSLTTPAGFVKPGLPRLQQQGLTSIWRGAAPKAYDDRNTMTDPLVGGMWLAEFWNAGSRRMRDVVIVVQAHTAYAGWQRANLPPEDWNIN